MNDLTTVKNIVGAITDAQDRAKRKTPYDHGYDAGVNGPNETNCNFAIFGTPENTREWERGKADGDKVTSES